MDTICKICGKDLSEPMRILGEDALDLHMFTHCSVDFVMFNAIRELRNKYDTDEGWGEHPEYPLIDWRFEAGNGYTRLGYWEWVVHKTESEGI